MRVLVCSSEAPLAPLNGMRLQVTQLCDGLRAAGHDVSVLAYRWPDQVGDPPEGVRLTTLPMPGRSRPRRAADLVLTRAPGPVALLAEPMRRALRKRLKEDAPDVVHVAGSPLAGVADVLDGTPAVIAPLDAWHLNRAAVTAGATRWTRPLYAMEERRVRRFAASAYRPYSAAVFVSEPDAAAVRALDPAVRTAVIPNGVDADEYAPSEDVPRDQGLIVLTGAMDYPPNEQAAAFVAREVLPLIRAEQPDAWLALVGRHPSAAVLALGELDGVEVTGEVPDVRPWLWRAEAFACLMRSGTGIKNKLLEALAAGTPCVATPLATQGMAVEHGEHLLIAESAEASAHALGRLLVDAELRERLGRAGREYVIRTHSWAAMARAYAELYERAVSEASARA